MPGPKILLCPSNSPDPSALLLSLFSTQTVVAPQLVDGDGESLTFVIADPSSSSERDYDARAIPEGTTAALALGNPVTGILYARQDAFTPLPPASYSITTVQLGTVSAPAIVDVAIDPNTYGGSFTVDSLGIPWDASSAVFQAQFPDFLIQKTGAFVWRMTALANGVYAPAVDVTNLLVLTGMKFVLDLSNATALAHDFGLQNADLLTAQLALQVTFPNESSATYFLGAVSVGLSVLSLGVLPGGVYEPDLGAPTSDNSILVSLANKTRSWLATSAFGRSLLAVADAAGLRTALGLGTAATRNVGTAAGNAVVLSDNAKLPPVDGSQLTNLPIAPALPLGALGFWFADQFVSAAHPYIPNAAAPLSPVSINLFSASRRMFTNGEWWVGFTGVDSVVIAPDGTLSASTFTATGDWHFGSGSFDNLPAGDYTIAISARSNTGGNQTFAFSGDNTGTRSPVQTATTAWQRFSYIFTLYSPSSIRRILLCSSDGATGANLQLCDFELYSGGVDYGPQTYAGQLYLGSSAFDTRATGASGVLDLSNGGYGLIQFKEPRVLNGGMTAVCIASKVATGSAYQAFLSSEQNYNQFAAFFELSTRACGASGANSAYFGEVAGTGLWNFLNRGYFSFTQRLGSTTSDVYINGGHLLSRAGGAMPMISDLLVGVTGSTSLPCGYKIHAIALYPRQLSDAEIITVNNYLAMHAAASAITLPPPRFYIALGDSISGGFGYSWPYKYGAVANPPVIGANYATSGSVVSTVTTAQLPKLAAFMQTVPMGSEVIVSLALGANDLKGSNPDFVTAYAALCDSILALGVKLAVATVLPSTSGYVNSQRATANSIIASWQGVHADAILLFGEDATMGPDSAASDTNLYADGTHPTDAGANNLEAIVASVLNAL